VFDEVQDTSETAIANTRKILTTSPIKAEIYLGTPNLVNSSFDNQLWEKSSQQFYHYRCVKCDKIFLLSPYNWEEVWKEGLIVECTHCKALQSKIEAGRGGEWIPLQTDSSKIINVGFHFSQILHPTITKEYVQMERERNPEMQFNNEVLGLFFAGLERPLSFAEIIEKCAVPYSHLSLKSIVVPPEETYMGIDWGGGSAKRERKSGDAGDAFTVVVIISWVEKEKKYRIEFAHIFENVSNTVQLERISEWIRQYNCKEVIADIGFGHMQVEQLQEEWGNKVKGCYYSAVKGKYNYNHERMMVTADRSSTLEETLTEIKEGRWIFPYSNPSSVEWLAQHCSNVVIENRAVQGVIRKHFSKPYGKPNDGLMAANYARIGHQFHITSGFSISTNPQGRRFPKSLATPGFSISRGTHSNNMSRLLKHMR
jgi:DNA-directed RNA polymerase subunit RPC12/RpoP